MFCLNFSTKNKRKKEQKPLLTCQTEKDDVLIWDEINFKLKNSKN